ncbi:unnamed protein product [[Candida] boidinii]|nr:unnamed protein product [[Candida] boidinii]
MLKPGKKYNLEYYMKTIDEIVSMGTHLLGIKDMAGTLKPTAARLLVSTIRKKYPSLPIHVHTHDSAGTGIATYVECAKAGADVVDCALNSLSGLTSQPSMSAYIAALDGELNTGVTLDQARELDSYWAEMRLLYSCFEADLKGPDPEVNNGLKLNVLMKLLICY